MNTADVTAPRRPACWREMRFDPSPPVPAKKRAEQRQRMGRRYYCGHCNAWLVARALDCGVTA